MRVNPVKIGVLLGLGLLVPAVTVSLALALPLAPLNSPDLTTSTKRADRSLVAVGDSFTYTIVISNGGAAKAVHATMVDALPDGMQLAALSATSGAVTATGPLTKSTITWTGALPPFSEAAVVAVVALSNCLGFSPNSAVISESSLSLPVVVTATTAEGFDWPEVVTYTDQPVSPGFEMDLRWVVTPAMVSSPVSLTAWSWVTTGVNPVAQPRSSPGMMQFNAYDLITGFARLSSRALRLPVAYRPILQFWMRHDLEYSSNLDAVYVQMSVDGGLTYSNVVTAPVYRYDGLLGWKLHVFDLSPALPSLPQDNVRLALLGESRYGNNIYIDDVALLFRPMDASFEVSPPLLRTVGQEVVFTGTTVPGAIESVAWDFGDDPTLRTPAAVSHIYSASGVYNVRMLACGFEVATRTLTVLPTQGITLITSAPSPVSSAVYFTAPLIADSLGVSYTWQFGDGGLGQAGGAYASHAYTRAGLFTASVAIAGAGDWVTVTAPVRILSRANLSIKASAMPNPVLVRNALTYTAVVSNGGPAPAGGVYLTGTFTPGVRIFSSIGRCTPAVSGLSCNLGKLEPFASAVVSAVVIPSAAGLLTGSFMVGAAEVDDEPANNTAVVTTTVEPHRRYLAWIKGRWPALPDTPFLYPITPLLGDGNFAVSWLTASLAISYVVQESTDAAFNSAVTVYTGAAPNWAASGKPAGLYYYRVKAHNTVGDSGWSNTRSISVVPSPYNGAWLGTTSQGKPIRFNISGGAVTFLTFSYVLPGCAAQAITYYLPPAGPKTYVTNNGFELPLPGATYTANVKAGFTSLSAAAGSIRVAQYDQCSGTVVASWSGQRP